MYWSNLPPRVVMFIDVFLIICALVLVKKILFLIFTPHIFNFILVLPF